MKLLIALWVGLLIICPVRSYASVPFSGHIILDDIVDNIFVTGKVDKRTIFVVPTDGRLSSYYGWRVDPFIKKNKYHFGIDIANAAHAMIHAAADGEVIFAGQAKGCGIAVEIKHFENVTSRYCHLNSRTVNVGDKLAGGDVIGQMGATGRARGKHLHFELMANGVYLDPAKYLMAR